MSTIFDNLKKYENSEYKRFHMPGHKGRPQKSCSELSSFFPLDVTELPETDNLFAESSFLLDSEKNLARVFGADFSFFLVGGSSCGVISMLLAAFSPGDTVIIGRNCHQSVIFGMIMCGINPVYVMPEATESGIGGGINPQKIEEEFVKNPQIKGVLITSPTYHGMVMEIEKIAEITHRHGGVLLVDEAHGAHFPFSSLLPKSAIKMGADAAVSSLHKTLPSPNQTAVLNCKGFLKGRIKTALSLTQTSSPSFPLLSLADSAVREFSADGEKEFKRLYNDCMSIFGQKFNNISLVKNSLGKHHILSCDFTKITVTFENAGITPHKAAEFLKKNYKISCEMVDNISILFMLSPYNTKEDVLCLKEALISLDGICKGPQRKTEPVNINPVVSLSPRDAYFAPKKSVFKTDAVGKICAENVVICPPCMPIVTFGEVITKELIPHIPAESIDVVI